MKKLKPRVFPTEIGTEFETTGKDYNRLFPILKSEEYGLLIRKIAPTLELRNLHINIDGVYVRCSTDTIALLKEAFDRDIDLLDVNIHIRFRHKENCFFSHYDYKSDDSTGSINYIRGHEKEMLDFFVGRIENDYYEIESVDEFDLFDEVLLNEGWYLGVYENAFRDIVRSDNVIDIESITIEPNQEIKSLNMALLMLMPDLMPLEELDVFYHKTNTSKYATLVGDINEYDNSSETSPFRYTLLRADLKSITLYFVKAMCISTGRTFLLSVPPTTNVKDACGTFVHLIEDNIPYIDEIVRQGEVYRIIYKPNTVLVKSGKVRPLTGDEYFSKLTVES